MLALVVFASRTAMGRSVSTCGKSAHKFLDIENYIWAARRYGPIDDVSEPFGQ
jgi:hypothetical protein